GLGIMITASHNPAGDNGIKLFAATGYKLAAPAEAAIERALRRRLAASPASGPRRGRKGKRTRHTDAAARYIARVRQTLPLPRALPPTLIDCGNGACSAVARRLFARHPAITCIHDRPNGANINAGCGALAPERLLASVREAGAAFGAAFDGDGDRCIFVHREYGPIETEKLLVLFAAARASGLRRRGALVVSTEICNKALEWNLGRRRMRLLETAVGDRNVVEAVRRHRALLGAEPSGHFFFPAHARSMDGLIACAHFLRIVAACPEAMAAIRALAHFRRVTRDIPVGDPARIDCARAPRRVDARLQPTSEKSDERPSMWDPIVRLYYDYRARNRFALVKKLVADTFPNL
ncbi:MAG: hypothetical protein HY543_05575, partial [Deltaproteobacteria bacterium]|nr:hypothetical protein [Deltaproteobacteria bacterium]